MAINESLYPYAEVPLTPAIIEDLTIQLFIGRLVSRQVIIDEVIHHEINGGLKANSQDITSSIKKALSNLKAKGFVENPTLGYWRIGKISLMNNLEIDLQIPVEENIIAVHSIADKIIGSGSSTVYLYYLPMYRQKAEAENGNVWYCKIGKTDRDPLQRVLSQAATALPEKPHIALLFKTDLPSHLETAIHSILTLRGKKVDSSPGSEWFLTSPDEVEKIVLDIFEQSVD